MKIFVDTNTLEFWSQKNIKRHTVYTIIAWPNPINIYLIAEQANR